MSTSPPEMRAALQGRRILVAEDEYMIAQELVGMLFDAGAETLGPVGRVGDALRLVQVSPGRIDAALLDVNLYGDAVWPVVEHLKAQGVPIVLTTGYDSAAIPAAYAGLQRCEKPVTMHEIARALAETLEKAGT